MPLHPTVLWAQRADVIYLTVEISDINNHKIDLTEKKLTFTGTGEKEQNEYAFDIEFYKDVDVEKSKKHLTARNLTMAVYKKEEAWWPKLQTGNKLNFVKVDFQKWKDEDDEDIQENDPMGTMDFQSLMQQAGANGGLNMDDLTPPNLDDMPEEDGSTDEEDELKKD
ncbi:hypothetical protein [Parasitella parasitica]|uniref:CS domain-containing protein n=1 Tax=Parasitella parasitica TaxID=35722 RepID=A0A0B7N7P7_9FUNG|nr:hypothetical protein [Parasitella parasitica]